MSEPKKVYLRRRRPCWECSAPLATVTTGANAGCYVAAVVLLDGHPRLLHVDCASRREDEERSAAWNDFEKARDEREARSLR